MNGPAVYNLEIRSVSHVGSYHAIWAMTSDQGKDWHLAQCSIPPNPMPFKVRSVLSLSNSECCSGPSEYSPFRGFLLYHTVTFAI